jgi:hypothetical protein
MKTKKGLILLLVTSVGIFGAIHGIKDGKGYDNLLSGKSYRSTQKLCSSPYAVFGDSSVTLMTEQERTQSHLLEIGGTSKLILDMKTGVVKIYNKTGELVHTLLLDADEIARFMTQDRFAEKYHSMSPYQYAANNPIRFIDVNGDSINVASVQQYDKDNGTNYLKIIIDDLQNQTGLTYTVTSTGQLVYKKDENGNAVVSTTTNSNGETIQVGSSEARNLMQSSIANERTVYSQITEGRTNSITGGFLMRFNPKQINSMITGTCNVDNRTQGWGMTFMHELSHSFVGGSLDDITPTSPQTGFVEERMNKIRNQLNEQGQNYGQRETYYGYGFGAHGDYLPFDINSRALMDANVIPMLGMKYIKL